MRTEVLIRLHFKKSGKLSRHKALSHVFRSIKLENDKFFERARSLRKEMSDWSLSVAKEADEILERFPLEIKDLDSPDLSF